MRKLLLCVGFAAALAACGDNDLNGDDQPSPDANVAPDAAVEPDAMVCPSRAPGEVGGGCDDNADCDSAVGAGDGLCFVGPINAVIFPPEGFCIVDNGAGDVCATDADCGTGNLCVDSAGYKYCLPACDCPGGGCPMNQACFDSFNGFPNDKPACVPGSATAVDGDACSGVYECNEFSDCLADSIEFPGGMCSRYSCTIGDDTTCNGGTCIANDPPFTGTTCVESCTDDNDCRQAEGYVCFDPDGAGTAQNYCRHPHVGDACTTAADCSGGIWECRLAVPDGFPGGYCTQSGCETPGSPAECSPGALCRDHPTETEHYCADRCTGTEGTQGSCRTGYLCIDSDPDGAVTSLVCAPAGG